MLFRAALPLVFLLSLPLLGANPLDFEQIAKEAQQAQSADHLIESISLYRQGLQIKPTWRDGWWSVGTILYDQDRFPEAQDAFRHFIALSTNPGPGYAFLGLCEYEKRDYDHALQHFRAWASHGWSGTPQLIDVSVFHFALLLTRDGDFVQSLFLLAAEVEKSYKGPRLIEAMGLASLHMPNVPEDYPPEKREAVWLAGEAAFYAAVHPADFERADEYAHRLATHYDGTPNVHYFLGTLHKFESDDLDAQKEYQRELQISPKNAAAMLELAQIEISDNDVQEALKLARTAAELEPRNPEAHRTLGEALFKSGEVEGSVHEFEIAKGLAPDSAPVRFQLAAAYRKLKRTQEASREMAAFNLLKDKEMVMAPPSEKLHNPEPPK